MVRMTLTRATIMAAVCLLSSLAAGFTQAQVSAPLSAEHRVWLDREVRSIITEEERNYFLNLTGDKARESFIAAFWKAHDPTPGTIENEFRTEHYRRLSVAKARYGLESDRGRFYIRLGEPVQVITYNSPQLVSPMESWLYAPDRSSGLRYNFYVLFYIPPGSRDYVPFCSGVDDPGLLLSAKIPGVNRADTEWVLTHLLRIDALLAQLAISALPSEHRPIMADNPREVRRALARRNPVCRKLLKSISTETHVSEEQDLGTIIRIMDGAEPQSRERYVASSVAVWYRYHVLRNEQGRPRLYYVFQLNPRDIGMRDFYGRCYVLLQVRTTATGSDGREIASRSEYLSATYDPWDAFNGSAGPLICQGYLDLPSGRYHVRTEVRNPIDGRSFGFEDDVEMPNQIGRALQFSMPVLMRGESPAPSAGEDRYAYTFFGRSYLPASTNAIARGHDALVYFQLYNPRNDRTSTVPVRYQIISNRRVYWNSTEVLSVENLRQGGFFSRAIVLPTRDLPPGVYTLEISANSLTPPAASARLEFVISRDRDEAGEPVVAGVTK